MFCEQLGSSPETTIILTIVLQQVSVVYMTYCKQNTWRNCLIFSDEVANLIHQPLSTAEHTC